MSLSTEEPFPSELSDLEQRKALHASRTPSALTINFLDERAMRIIRLVRCLLVG